jgi:hypothetical protein
VSTQPDIRRSAYQLQRISNPLHVSRDADHKVAVKRKTTFANTCPADQAMQVNELAASYSGG